MTPSKLVCLIAALGLTACGDDGNAELVDAAPKVRPDSAPPTPVGPTLTSFQASPSQLTAGFATNVTWNWTYGGLPYPDPNCTIDNGVGAVIKGQTTSVIANAITTYTLTCTNSAGTAMRPVVITVPPVAPNIATFVATPPTTQIGLPTNVTWTWTYSAPPTPPPTCSISPTVGTVTNGQTTSLTQSIGTTYTLQCVNSAGTRFLTRFVNAATAPALLTFTATPNTVTIGMPTNITFAWSFSNTPNPAATCSIDQGVGPITSGTTRNLTLAATTIYTLTCTNLGGSAMQPVTVTAQ